MPRIPAFEWRLSAHGTASAALLRLLDQPGLAVVSVTLTTPRLCAAAAELRPHAVLLDARAGGAGACLDALQRAAAVSPPKVILLGGKGEADAFSPAWSAEALALSLREALYKPMGYLAGTEEKRTDIAKRMLSRLGMSGELLGFSCASLAAAWLSALPCPYPPARYWLYPLLSERLHAAPSALERRLRVAVESAWLRGDLKAQGELFGLTVSAERGKPTTMEFLCMLSEHIRLCLTSPSHIAP